MRVKRTSRQAAAALRVAGACAAVLACSVAVLAEPAPGRASARAAAPGYVLIYTGPGTCDGCAEAVGDVADAAGLDVRYVSQPARVARLLGGAVAFVVPGTGDDIEAMRVAFNRTVGPALRAYLRNGGRYWGICGGAYLAVRHYWATEDDQVAALGIVPADAETYGDGDAARLERVRWNGSFRRLYFQSGPSFTLAGRPPGARVLATYADGSIAALSYRYGKGKIILSGPHPEATEDWLDEDDVPTAGWQPTFPLAVAMLEDLVS